MTQIEEEIQTTDEAFLSASTPKYLAGIKLEPLSLMRQTIGMELSGPESSAFFDAVCKIWLCTMEPRKCLATRIDRDAARVEAFAWAEARGFTLRNYKPVLDIYRQLNAEIEASTEARVQTSDGDPPKNSGGLRE
jgi:hypothetical protein